MKAAAALSAVWVLSLSSCATPVPGRVEVSDEVPTYNDPKSRIACPSGSEKRTDAEFYRQLDATWDADETFPPPDGYAAPKMLRPPTVMYPRNILGLVKPGFVSVAFTVGIDGAARDPQVVCSSDRAFDRAALDAIHTTRFVPAKLDGEAIAQVAILPIEFAIQ
ncbi:MAG: TonB family protein [Luteimonas sp.]